MKASTTVHKPERVLQGSGLLPHAAIHSVADGAAPTHDGVQFGWEFSQVPAHAADLAAPCPVTPRRCPFGGACHTCPARVQAKLAISQPDDEDEREADRVAETVMRMPAPEEEDKGPCRQPGCARTVQRQAADGVTQSEIPPVVHEVLRSPGRPLDAATRAFMEPRLRHDFGHVRVHTDAKAAESARAIRALAYTLGHDVVFGPGQYQPQTNGGKKLLAHELTHVLQQNCTPHNADILIQRQIPYDPTQTTLTPEAVKDLSDEELKTQIDSLNESLTSRPGIEPPNAMEIQAMMDNLAILQQELALRRKQKQSALGNAMVAEARARMNNPTVRKAYSSTIPWFFTPNPDLRGFTTEEAALSSWKGSVMCNELPDLGCTFDTKKKLTEWTNYPTGEGSVWWGEGVFTCNVFVYDVLYNVGHPAPLGSNQHYFDPEGTYNSEGALETYFEDVQPDQIQPGDVFATTGHMEIVTSSLNKPPGEKGGGTFTSIGAGKNGVGVAESTRAVGGQRFKRVRL